MTEQLKEELREKDKEIQNLKAQIQPVKSLLMDLFVTLDNAPYEVIEEEWDEDDFDSDEEMDAFVDGCTWLINKIIYDLNAMNPDITKEMIKYLVETSGVRNED